MEGRLKCGKAECPQVYPAGFWKQILPEADPETRTQCSPPRKTRQRGAGPGGGRPGWVRGPQRGPRWRAPASPLCLFRKELGYLDPTLVVTG